MNSEDEIKIKAKDDFVHISINGEEVSITASSAYILGRGICAAADTIRGLSGKDIDDRALARIDIDTNGIN